MNLHVVAEHCRSVRAMIWYRERDLGGPDMVAVCLKEGVKLVLSRWIQLIQWYWKPELEMSQYTWSKQISWFSPVFFLRLESILGIFSVFLDTKYQRSWLHLLKCVYWDISNPGFLYHWLNCIHPQRTNFTPSLRHTATISGPPRSRSRSHAFLSLI